MTRTQTMILAALAAVVGLAGCGKKEAPETPASAPPAVETPAATDSAPPADVVTEAVDPAPDFADGMAGGPDFYAVSGADESYGLNLRGDAGGEADIIGALANGDVVRNLGCKEAGGERWCQVELPGDMPARGWVPGRYLIESAAPAGQ